MKIKILFNILLIFQILMSQTSFSDEIFLKNNLAPNSFFHLQNLSENNEVTLVQEETHKKRFRDRISAFYPLFLSSYLTKLSLTFSLFFVILSSGIFAQNSEFTPKYARDGDLSNAVKEIKIGELGSYKKILKRTYIMNERVRSFQNGVLVVNDGWAMTKPGEGRSSLLVTVNVADCVGLILYDSNSKVGSLAHITNDTRENQFAGLENEIDKILMEMKKQGANTGKLTVKMVGGSTDYSEPLIEFLENYLKKNGIQDIEQDLGADEVLDYAFDTETGSLYFFQIDRATVVEFIQEAKVVDLDDTRDIYAGITKSVNRRANKTSAQESHILEREKVYKWGKNFRLQTSEGLSTLSSSKWSKVYGDKEASSFDEVKKNGVKEINKENDSKEKIIQSILDKIIHQKELLLNSGIHEKRLSKLIDELKKLDVSALKIYQSNKPIRNAIAVNSFENNQIQIILEKDLKDSLALSTIAHELIEAIIQDHSDAVLIEALLFPDSTLNKLTNTDHYSPDDLFGIISNTAKQYHEKQTSLKRVNALFVGITALSLLKQGTENSLTEKAQVILESQMTDIESSLTEDIFHLSFEQLSYLSNLMKEISFREGKIKDIFSQIENRYNSFILKAYSELFSKINKVRNFRELQSLNGVLNKLEGLLPEKHSLLLKSIISLNRNDEEAMNKVITTITASDLFSNDLLALKAIEGFRKKQKSDLKAIKNLFIDTLNQILSNLSIDSSKEMPLKNVTQSSS